MNYLQDARDSLVQCATACVHWSSPYNGEVPPPDIFMESVLSVNKNGDIHDVDTSTVKGENKPIKNGANNKVVEDSSSASSVKLLSHGNVAQCNSSLDCLENGAHQDSLSSENRIQTDSKRLNNNKQVSRNLFQDNLDRCNNLLKIKPSNTCPDLSKLYKSLNDVDSFLAYIDEVSESGSSQTASESIDDILQFLDSMESAVNTSSAYATSDKSDHSISQVTETSSYSADQSSCSSNQLTTDFTHITRPTSTSTPSFLPLSSFKDVSSYVNITMSGLDQPTAASRVLQELPQRHLNLSVLSSSPSESNMLSPGWHPDDVPLGLASPAVQVANRSITPRYPDGAPNIGTYSYVIVVDQKLLCFDKTFYQITDLT